jgi:hypothetical protein
VSGRELARNCYVKLPDRGGKYTFADALRGVHLRAIFHGVQGKVNLGQRLLLLDCADGILHVLALIDILGVVLHGGRAVQGTVAV